MALMKFPESNTLKLLLLAICQSLTFYAAFEKIFFQTNGLSILEISWITIIFSLCLVLLEVPSGALSDRWVRKYVLSLSVLFAILGIITLALSNGFWGFAAATILTGISFVLNSGTNTSILYDSLKEVGKVTDFEKYLAIRRILSGAGFAAASLFGGFAAAHFGISFAIWITLIPLIIGLLLCLSLREPVFHKTTGELNFFKHISHTAKHLTRHVYFRQVIFLSVIIMTVHILIKDYSQLYYFAIGFSLASIGVLSFLEGLKEMLANYMGALIPQQKNLPSLYGVLLLFMSGALLVCAFSPNIFGVIGLFVASGIFFIIDVPLLGGFHKQVDSSIRATADSFLNLVTEGTKMLFALLFAFAANLYSIEIAFGVLGVIVLIYTVYYLLVGKTVLESGVTVEV